MDLHETFNRWIQPLKSRVSNMILKSLLVNVDDSNQIQLVKLSALAGEEADFVERVQNYGFTSVPPKDADAVMVAIGSDRDHPVVIAADSGEFRKKGLQNGEVAVYHKDGSSILFKANGDIEVDAAGNKVNMTGGEVIADANSVKLGGTSGLKKLIDDRLITAYNAHTHPAPGGATSAPSVPLGPPTTPVSTTNTEAK